MNDPVVVASTGKGSGPFDAPLRKAMDAATTIHNDYVQDATERARQLRRLADYWHALADRLEQ